MSKVEDNIFRYDNYRVFLKDYFKEQKQLKSSFSHRFFALKAGFSSSSFAAHVMDSKRNLTKNSLASMVKGLSLKGKQAAYFESLVYFNQAKTFEEKDYYFKKIERIRESTKFYKVNQKQFRYYNNWYYAVVRELAVLSDWEGDYKKLASMVRPEITAEKAREAVEYLEHSGFIIKQSSGEYDFQSDVVTSEGIPGFILKSVRKSYILKAIEASESIDPSERHLSQVTVSLSKNGYKKFIDEINELRKKILLYSINEEHPEVVLQFNFQGYPLSFEFNSKKGRGLS